MKKVTAYKCDYCGLLLESKMLSEKHEEKCFYNPSNKVCEKCEYFVDGFTESDYCKKDLKLFIHNCKEYKERSIWKKFTM